VNVARFIARRYFKAKKSKNIINLITKISVFGITISTAALVVLLSAFNGIEDMVLRLYSDFDPDITIRSAKAKTFDRDFLPIDQLLELQNVESLSHAIEEVVILKHENKWVHGKMLGVDTTFLKMAKIDEHLIDGEVALYDGDVPLAIFGAGLLDKLDAYIPVHDFGREQIIFHVPLREGKFRPGRNPLSIQLVDVAGRVNYNREVNYQYTIVPLELARDLLKYENDISAVFLAAKPGTNLQKFKRDVQELVGDDFEVKTTFEKNELIFKTSQSERVIVFIILLFIFILSSVNLVASIVMLFVEKKKDMKTLSAMGAQSSTIFKIFFFEGLMISGRGVVLGLLIGYLVCIAQIQFGLLEMPNSGGEFFPMKLTWNDAVFITLSVSVLGFLAAFIPSRYLTRNLD
jgi:lipoprotein-releasing system permease protein